MTDHRRIKNSCIGFISNLCLLFFISTSFASAEVTADKIKTQTAHKVLQLGDTTDENSEQALELPSDVAVHAGKIYVVDGSHHRIMVYDLKGKFLFQFGSKGEQPGQLNYPVGIDVSTDNRVYVADSGNHRIQIFSNKGVFLSGFTIKSDKKNNKKGNKKEIRPIDVIRHSRTGNIIVSCSNHRLMIYTAKGKLLKKWGSNGMNRGEFRYPATIVELKDGRIAVVDVLNSRAQVFNMNGSISLTVGEWGVLPGQLFRPKGIAIDQQGNFYISDSYMNVVQKFSDGGDFVAVLGDKGKPYDMLTPVGMSISQNRLYVVEMKKNRVSVYQLGK